MTEVRERRRKPNPPMEISTLITPAYNLPIIGIDASLTNTGIGILHDGSLQSFSYEPKKLRGGERLAWFRDHLRGLCMRVGPELVMLEGYAFGARMQREAMGELGGVIRLVLHDLGIPVKIVQPTCLKLFITGKGAGPKDNMSKEIYKRFGVDLTDNNQVDAAGLAIMGLALQTDMSLTEFQKRALGKIGND